MRKKSSKMLRRTAATFLSCALMLTTIPSVGFAEELSGGSSDMKEEKTESKDTSNSNLSDSDLQNVQALLGTVQETGGLTGTWSMDGYVYQDLFGGNSQEAMKTISSKELLKKVLTAKLPSSGDVVKDVWAPAARAALLSGGYNHFYYVDDYWTPSTFYDAFDDWNTTWCSNQKNGTGHFIDIMGDSSRLQYAQDFNSVGESMKQSIKDCSDYVYGGLDGGRNAYNNILDNWKVPDYNGDILYNVYTKVIYREFIDTGSSAHMGYSYDSFALCFYDFKVVPNYDKLKPGDDDTACVSYELKNEDNKTTTFATNESAEDISIDKSRSEGKTTTTSNTVSTSSSLNFTTGGSVGYEHGFGASPFVDKISFNINFSTTKSNTTTESRTSGESVTHTDTYSVKGTAKPSTQINITQSDATAQGAISYSCPVTYQYKVAIISVCGDYSGALPNRTVNVNYAGLVRNFGSADGDALADLQYRYANPSFDDFKLVWDKDNLKPVANSLNRDRFYSNVGGTMTFVVKYNLSSISPLTPLHPLDHTAIDPDQATYTIRLSEDHPDQNKMNLGSVNVKGISLLTDGTSVPYYGFEKGKGKWKLCDSNGVAIDQSEYAEIQNTVSGTFLVAKKVTRDPIYLKYFIDDNFYPVTPGSLDNKYLKTENLSSSAVIEVYIYDSDSIGAIDDIATSSNAGPTNSPKTGDNNHIGIYAMLMVAAFSAMVLLASMKRKQNNEQ